MTKGFGLANARIEGAIVPPRDGGVPWANIRVETKLTRAFAEEEAEWEGVTLDEFVARYSPWLVIECVDSKR